MIGFIGWIGGAVGINEVLIIGAIVSGRGVVGGGTV